MDWLATWPGTASVFIASLALIVAVWRITARYSNIKVKDIEAGADGEIRVKKASLTESEIERIAGRIHGKLIAKHQCFQTERLALIHEGGHILASGLAVALRNNKELGSNGNTQQALDDTVAFQAKLRQFQPVETTASR